jgi:hypothetical protein
MELPTYSFELLQLQAGNWLLMLFKDGLVIGGFVGSDLDDLQTVGDNWLVIMQMKVNRALSHYFV